jgi:hypothetical protein
VQRLLGELPVRDPDRPVAGRLHVEVAPVVALDREPVAVRERPVDLERDALGGPDRVDLPPGDADVRARPWQPGGVDDVEQQPLGLRSRVPRSVGQQCLDPLRRSAA